MYAEDLPVKARLSCVNNKAAAESKQKAVMPKPEAGRLPCAKPAPEEVEPQGKRRCARR